MILRVGDMCMLRECVHSLYIKTLYDQVMIVVDIQDHARISIQQVSGDDFNIYYVYCHLPEALSLPTHAGSLTPQVMIFLAHELINITT